LLPKQREKGCWCVAVVVVGGVSLLLAAARGSGGFRGLIWLVG